MPSARTLLATGLAAVFAIGFFACAEGSAIQDPATGTGPGGGGVGGGGLGGSGSGGDEDGSSAKSSAAHSSASATHAASSGSSGDGGSGGDGGAGDGGAGSTSSVTVSASSGIVCDFTSPNQCANAESLGAIAGDEDGSPITLSGNTSKWYTIRIEERDSSIGGEDLSWRVNLVSPAGMNYDLVVHEGPQDGDVDCNGGVYPGTPDVSGETAYHSYDDDQGIGGEDDSLWLAIEVVYVSGEMCTLSDVWMLTIEGHV